MGSIRIIQLSDLLVGPGFDSAQILKAFRTCIHKYPLGHFDYLLICGNLTADGSSRSFRRAEELIGKLARDILKDGGHRTRVILVPGRNDIQLDRYAEPKYKQFADFHDRFFAKQISGGVVAPFKPERPMYRELKDLTLLGVCHWNEAVTRAGGNGRIVFFDAVEQAANLAEDLHLKYRDGTPTVLVTAESPVLAWDVRLRLRDLNIRKTLDDRVRLTLHCFGASDTTCLSFEPFVYQHIGVSTGPRHNGGVWPLRFNAIELDSGNYHSDLSDYRQKEARSSLRLTVYEQSGPEEQWDEDEVVKGELNSLLARRHPIPELSVIHFRELLAKLEGWLHHKQEGLALVTGAPGIGLRQLVDSQIDWQKFGKLWARIIKVRWSRYDLMKGQIDRALEIVRQRREHTLPWEEHPLPIVILSDEAYEEARKSHEEQWFQTVMREGIEAISGGRSAIFLWVVETFEPPRDNTYWSFGSIRISARTTGDLDGLMEEYSYRIPLDLDRDGRFVSDLSGGYVGIAGHLLNRAKARFSDWPGPFPMRQQVGRDLLEQTLELEPLQKMSPTKELTGAIRACHKGREILSYVQGLVRDRVPKLGWNLTDEAVKIDFTALVKHSMRPGYDPRHVGSLLRASLAVLVEAALLDYEENDVYSVRVIAPFLEQEEIRFRAFLCYPREDKDTARQLREKIERVCGPGAEVLMLEGPGALEGGTVDSHIQAALRRSNNFILLALGHLTRYQRGEVEIWAKTWRRTAPGNDRAFVIAQKRSDIEIPVDLAPDLVIELEHSDLDDAALKIGGALAPLRGTG